MTIHTLPTLDRLRRPPGRCGGRCSGCPLAGRSQPRLGLALGGGGAKAAAHLGVLKVFEQAGLQVHAVTASSAGALAGLFFCAGYSPDEMVEIMSRELVDRSWTRYVPGSQAWRLWTLLRGGGLQGLIRRYIGARNLEDLKIPLAVSATDLQRGEAVILDRGPIETAVLATMSLPGVARPVLREGRWLVDGSLLCDLPLAPLREQQMAVSVGVNLVSLAQSARAVSARPDLRWSVWQVLSQSIAMQLLKLSESTCEQLDVVIRPDLTTLSMTDFHSLPAMVSAGQRGAHHCMGKVLQSLADARKREFSASRNQCPNRVHTDWGAPT